MSRAGDATAGAETGVDVHYTPTEHVSVDPERRAHYLALLSDEERERHGRFRFERDRHIYLIAHALTRTVLAGQLDCAPQQLRFESGAHGKPDLVLPRAEPPLHFNLSHTHGLVACATSRLCPVGVDVERVDRRAEVERLAERVLSVDERRDLHSQQPAARTARFFQYWTLKEAYIKAVGKGLAVPLDQVTFSNPTQEPIGVSFGGGINDKGHWQLLCTRPIPSHFLSVAFSCPQGAKLAIRLKETLL